jgi:hypothetical protein
MRLLALSLRHHAARRAAITIVYQLYGERKFPSRALQGHSQKGVQSISGSSIAMALLRLQKERST